MQTLSWQPLILVCLVLSLSPHCVSSRLCTNLESLHLYNIWRQVNLEIGAPYQWILKCSGLDSAGSILFVQRWQVLTLDSELLGLTVCRCHSPFVLDQSQFALTSSLPMSSNCIKALLQGLSRCPLSLFRGIFPANSPICWGSNLLKHIF